MPSNGVVNILLLVSRMAGLPNAIMDTRVDQSSARTHMEKSSAQAENNVQGAKYFYPNNVANRQRDDVHMKDCRRSVGHRLDARLKKSGVKEQRGFFSGIMSMKTSS